MVELLQRNVAIIADGGSDYAIFKRIIECIIEGNYSSPSEVNFVELRNQSIRDYVDRYWTNTKKSDPALPSPPAIELQNKIFSELTKGFDEFAGELDSGIVTNKDILLLTTDAERRLSSEDDYFSGYGFHVVKILESAIEKFYNFKANQDYSFEYLPLILPLVIFPSTEILIASARSLLSKCRSKKPTELKQFLYQTSNIHTMDAKALEDKALKYLNEQGLQRIYKDIPAARILIQTLSTFNPLTI